MSGLPWYKRDPNAFIEGCQRGNLTLEEVGAYSLLIDEMYRSGAPLLDDVRHGCAVLRCDPRVWIRVRATLIRKGKIYATSGGHLSNLRVEHELKTQCDLRETRSRAARAARANSDDKKFTEAELRCNSTVTEAELSPTLDAKSLISNDTEPANARHLPGRYRYKKELPTGVVGTDVPTPIDRDVRKAFEEYNLTASRAGWTGAKKITTNRRRHIRARLRDGGMDGWMRALGEAEGQPFLAGDNDRGWRMDIDWFVLEANQTKVLERKYQRGRPSPPFNATEWIRVFREHEYRHPQLTDEMLAAAQ